MTHYVFNGDIAARVIVWQDQNQEEWNLMIDLYGNDSEGEEVYSNYPVHYVFNDVPSAIEHGANIVAFFGYDRFTLIDGDQNTYEVAYFSEDQQEMVIEPVFVDTGDDFEGMEEISETDEDDSEDDSEEYDLPDHKRVHLVQGSKAKN